MTTLEDKLTDLLDADLSREETVCQAAKLFLQHGPKKLDGWGNHLRRIADYIDSLPRPIELSAKEVGVLISLIDKGLKW